MCISIVFFFASSPLLTAYVVFVFCLQSVLKRVEQFHTDSVVCGLSALALRTNSPTVLRTEALEEYASSATTKHSAYVFGSDVKVAAEKAVVANVAAVREWDSNGTVFGYNEKLNHKAGEFGHNDFYPGMSCVVSFIFFLCLFVSLRIA
jgi:hypothetical protein